MTKIIARINGDAFPIKEQLLPWQKLGLSYTATGYGQKIPTTKMVRYGNRWRRIYCCIYSNIGTNYITADKGRNWIVLF